MNTGSVSLAVERIKKDNRGMHRWTGAWLALCFFQFQISSASTVFWSAYVELEYFSSETNQSTTNICECGAYGLDSPVGSAIGYVALPISDPLACLPDTSFNVIREPWIALIKRGNCTHTEKIRAAQRKGASAVVIYNIDGTGNATTTISHPGTGNTVVIMVSNNMGKELTNLILSDMEVFMRIEAANPHGPWVSPLWVYVMSFTFFGITAIILGYFIFIVIKRFYRNRQLQNQQRELKKVAEKAIAKLRVRTLQQTDPEVESEESSCAVCIESFKRGDVVTVLPCSHVFHKTCIEPWLLEHHTCPMCKYNILKGQVGVEINQEPSVPPAEVRFYPSSVSGALADIPDVVSSLERPTNASQSSDVRAARNQMSDCEDVDNAIKNHIYENFAFEEEQQSSELQDTNVNSRIREV